MSKKSRRPDGVVKQSSFDAAREEMHPRLAYFPKTIDIDLKKVQEKRQQMQAQERAEAEAAAKERDEATGRKCRVCGGDIVARYRQAPMRPFDWNTPIGCGADEDNLPSPAYVQGHHCSGCDIEYHR